MNMRIVDRTNTFGYFLFLSGLVLFALLLLGATLWPIIFLLPGIVLLYMGMNTAKTLTPLVIPGIFLAGTGFLLIYQLLTGHLHIWFYGWLLYFVLLGWALRFTARRMEVPVLGQIGSVLMTLAGTGFVLLGILVEFIATVAYGSRYGFVFAGGIMIVGLYYILRSGQKPPPLEKPKNQMGEPRIIMPGEDPASNRIHGGQSGGSADFMSRVAEEIRQRSERLRQDVENAMRNNAPSSSPPDENDPPQDKQPRNH